MNLQRKVYILYNRFKFRLKGIQFGTGMRVCNHLYLSLNGDNTVIIGNNFAFSSGSGFNPLARNIKGAIEMRKGARLSIGDNVGISSSCLWIYDNLTIESNTKIGADCIILDSDTHSLEYNLRININTDRSNAKKAGIYIGEGVLIGTRCIVLKGVSIGNHTIIGSGSVVTKSIPANCIAAGNPCKVIKFLNE